MIKRIGRIFFFPLLALPFLTPLLRWTTVPCTHDGHLHYFRVATMAYAWRSGLWFSRWLPDLAFGYGYPFFIYREPLPLYGVLFFHLLGMPLSAASNLFYALCLIASGIGMFLWVRDIFGTRSAIISGLAYMGAPYLLIDAVIRGNLPESVGLAVLPFLLWAGRRYLLTQSRWAWIALMLAWLILGLSHNISLFIFTPTLLVYLGALGLIHRPKLSEWLGRTVLIMGVGLGLTFFYAGSAVTEMKAITIEQSVNRHNNDFHNNYATFEEIFAPPAPKNIPLINAPLPIRLGWVPVGLAVIGILFIWREKDRERKWHTLLMVVAAAVYISMALPLTNALWERIPLIDFVQFPWRFIGRASLPIALLAGVPFSLLPKKWGWGAMGVTAIGVAFLWGEAVPYLFPNICTEKSYPTINDVHNYERMTGMVGVDPAGSYFPRTVKTRPNSSPLEADYQAGRTPQRFDASNFPAGTVIDEVVYRPNAASIKVTTSQPFTARYLTFAFPGWRVTIDGEEVPIVPSDPEGLITFAVPVGSHQISVEWGSTPKRTALIALSLCAGVIALVVAWRSPLVKMPTADSDLLWPFAVVGVALFFIKVGVLDRWESPWRFSAEPTVTHPTALDVAELKLHGYHVSRESVPSGGKFDIDLAWQALIPPSDRYQSGVLVVDEKGNVWSEVSTFRPRLYEDPPPTLFWQAGQWSWDSWEVQLLTGTPPGNYQLQLVYFKLDNLSPLTFYADNVAVGPTAIIGRITVLPAQKQLTFTPQRTVSAEIGGKKLVGIDQDRQEARPGDPLKLTLFWSSMAEDATQTSELKLVSENGSVAQTWRLDHPYRSDTAVREQQLVRLSAELSGGTYRLMLENSGLGQLAITPIERMWELPAELSAEMKGKSAEFTNGIVLRGVIQKDEELRLLWQTTTTTATSYRVFVHLVDANGKIVQQSDGEPAQWARPTTSWAVGEWITDLHLISAPQTWQTIRVGLYEPKTGERLLTKTGEQFVTLEK